MLGLRRSLAASRPLSPLQETGQELQGAKEGYCSDRGSSYSLGSVCVCACVCVCVCERERERERKRARWTEREQKRLSVDTCRYGGSFQLSELLPLVFPAPECKI